MKLWIAEKPDAGRQIAKALGGGTETAGHIKLPSGDVVTWAIGHLLESYMPDDYDPAFKKWSLDHLPILPDRFLRKPDPSKQAQLNLVCRLINQAKEIVIATDAGREGEAIAWTILDHAGWKGSAKRFWTSSLNESHLKKAVHQLIDDEEKKALYMAARIRSSMDWLDGINWSRYYNLRCVKYGDKVLSLGRVQTATLALLVDRDLAIDAFVPSSYFELKASMSISGGTIDLFHAPVEGKRITDRALAEEMARKTVHQPADLKVEKKPKTFSPPTPYNLPNLQMATSARWGWSAKKTLDVLQGLYEAGAVTYPRTDSGHLTDEMVEDMPRHLAALRKRPEFKTLADIQPVIRKSVFDSKKVEDHHGIIPTDEAVSIDRLGSDAKRLFDIIARRFLASLMPDAKGSTTTVSTVIKDVLFKTSGTVISEPGWKAVWGGQEDPVEERPARKGKGDEDADDADNRILPPVQDGQKSRSEAVAIIDKTTRPLPHYTEGTLLKAMINAGAKNDDAEVRDLLSNGGLGTQATRQEIIEKLKLRDFARLDGKKIISTPRAREFIAIIREDGNRLADVMATADLERELRQIEKDPASAMEIWKRFTQGLRSEMRRLLSGPRPRMLTPASPLPSSSAGRPSGQAAKPSRSTKSKRSFPSTGKPSVKRPRKSAKKA